MSEKCTKGTGRILRLNTEQKEKLEAMTSPKELERSERKRQYAALRRAIHGSAEPSLLAKYQLCNDAERQDWSWA